MTVSGKYDPANPPRITITGQSADGHYEEPLVAAILPIENVCDGTITLCSEARFRGECITLEDSRFISINITFKIVFPSVCIIFKLFRLKS